MRRLRTSAVAVALIVTTVIALVAAAGSWIPGESQFDGWFYDVIARDPTGSPSRFDLPALRYQRILYPIVARVLALGDPDGITWTLFLITFASTSFGTYVLARILDGWRVSPWYAAVWGLFIGQFLTVRFKMAESVCFFLALVAIWAIERKRVKTASFFFGLSMLTKELGLLFWLGYLAHGVTQRKWREVLILLGAVVPFGLWQVVLRLWLGKFGLQGADYSLPLVPFGGYIAWGVHPENVLALIILLPPAAIAIALAIYQYFKVGVHPLVVGLLLNTLSFTQLPAGSTGEMRSLGRLAIGFVLALLLFGARFRYLRVLNYSLLWLPFTAIYVASMLLVGVSSTTPQE